MRSEEENGKDQERERQNVSALSPQRTQSSQKVFYNDSFLANPGYTPRPLTTDHQSPTTDLPPVSNLQNIAILILTCLLFVQSFFVVFSFWEREKGIIIIPYYRSSLFEKEGEKISRPPSGHVSFHRLARSYLALIGLSPEKRGTPEDIAKRKILIKGLNIQEEFFQIRNDTHHLNEEIPALGAKIVRSFSRGQVEKIIRLAEKDPNLPFTIEGNPVINLLRYLEKGD